MELSNRTVCIITGASSGIGRALALRLAREGVTIGVIARRAELLESLVEEIASLGGTGLALPCDVTIRADFEAAVERMIERYGRLDLLVNNAGRGHFAYIEETPQEQIESIFALNVFALWYGTAPAIRTMKKQRSGLIVNIASIAGKIGFPGNAAYVAAKHATIGFTRALRSELAGTGVDATVVVPAGVATEWALNTEGGEMLEIFGYERERGLEIMQELGSTPLPDIPLLSPDDVAGKIVDMIRNPVPEFHTHPNSEELIAMFERDQEEIERRQIPFWLANREGYEKMKRG